MIDEKKLIEFINSKEFQMRFIRSPKSVQEILLEFIEEQPKIGEWIPCSERLPTTEECQNNDCRFILDDGNRRYQGLFDYKQKNFIWLNCNGTQIDKCVIAWQPLPPEYKPQERNDLK